ncbi:MAG: hypothetical protein SGPRY_011350 [Prymnesium sp.]
MSELADLLSLHSSPPAARPSPPPRVDLQLCPFSNIRIHPSRRALSRDEVKALCGGFAFHKLGALPRLIGQPSSLSTSWLTIGVLVDKTTAKATQSGGKFCVWKLSDLRAVGGTTMPIFLFSEACENAWKYLPGTVLALLSPRLLPPKEGRGDAAISVEKQEQIMRIGQATEFGICKGEKRDGKPCGQWVNTSECEYCEFHVMAALRQTERKSTKKLPVKTEAVSVGQPRNVRKDVSSLARPPLGSSLDAKAKAAVDILQSKGIKLEAPNPNSSKPDFSAHSMEKYPQPSQKVATDMCGMSAARNIKVGLANSRVATKPGPIGAIHKGSYKKGSVALQPQSANLNNRGEQKRPGEFDAFTKAFGTVDANSADATKLLSIRPVNESCARDKELDQVESKLTAIAKKDDLNERVMHFLKHASRRAYLIDSHVDERFESTFCRHNAPINVAICSCCAGPTDHFSRR